MQIDRTDESPCAPSTCEIYKVLYSKCTRVVGNGNQSDSKVFLDFVTDKKPAVGDKLDERLYLTNNSWFCGFAAVTLNPSGTTKCDRTGATLLTRKADLNLRLLNETRRALHLPALTPEKKASTKKTRGQSQLRNVTNRTNGNRTLNPSEEAVVDLLLREDAREHALAAARGELRSGGPIIPRTGPDSVIPRTGWQRFALGQAAARP